MTLPARGLAAALTLVLLHGTAAILHAQSLADVAKKEEERRKNLKESGKTYTNADLHPPATAQAPGADAAKPAETPAATADVDKAKRDDKDKDQAKDKSYWSGRMKE